MCAERDFIVFTSSISVKFALCNRAVRMFYSSNIKECANTAREPEINGDTMLLSVNKLVSLAKDVINDLQFLLHARKFAQDLSFESCCLKVEEDFMTLAAAAAMKQANVFINETRDSDNL